MLILLEQRIKLEQLVAAGEGRIDELLRQLELKNLEIAAQERINKLKDEEIVLLKSNAAIQQKIDEGKDTLHAAELKAAKPTFTQEAGKYSIGAIVGGIGVALIFLL